MSHQHDIEELIAQHARRLQKLRQRQAIDGYDTDPSVVMEIEDIVRTIAQLQGEQAGRPSGAGQASAPARTQGSALPQGNQGFVMTGGHATIGQLAAGPGSQAIQVTYNVVDQLRGAGKAGVAAAIADLLKSIETHAAEVQELDEVIKLVQNIAEETKKEKPSRLMLKTLIQGIREGVGPIAEVASRVQLLQEAIAAMLGWS